MTRLAALLSALTLAAPAAGEPMLSLPIACSLGQDCYIQQYMDMDPSTGFQDFTCNALSYDGHKGTDFAVPTVQAAQAGTAVRAAAPGRVLGVRDGMADVWSGKIDAAAINGRDCGNGLVIDHGNGWHTQYCHLQMGSLRVASGARVERGTVLGLVGMSGRSEFPHLHLSLRHNGTPVDPFNPDAAACGKATRTLWHNPAPAYQPGALISGGFATKVPDYANVKAGDAAEAITKSAPAIVAFAFAFGGRKGDVLRLALTGPGDLSLTDDYVLPKNRAQFFRAIGKKRPIGAWPAGEYLATSQLIRGGTLVSTRTDRLVIPE